MWAGMQNRLLEAFGGVKRAQEPPREGSSRAPRPQMFRSGLAVSTQGAGEECTGRELEWYPCGKNLLLSRT